MNFCRNRKKYVHFIRTLLVYEKDTSFNWLLIFEFRNISSYQIRSYQIFVLKQDCAWIIAYQEKILDQICRDIYGSQVLQIILLSPPKEFLYQTEIKILWVILVKQISLFLSLYSDFKGLKILLVFGTFFIELFLNYIFTYILLHSNTIFECMENQVPKGSEKHKNLKSTKTTKKYPKYKKVPKV